MVSHLKGIFSSLHQHKVNYLLCGGIAVNLYGIPRMTADIDVLIDWEEANLENFEAAIHEHGYKSNLFFGLKSLLSQEVRTKYRNERNLIAYSYSSDLFQSLSLDILVESPILFSDCWARKETKYLGDIPITLLHLDDLILLKEYANREQDRADITNLKKFYRKE